jgi:hypothetical protein
LAEAVTFRLKELPSGVRPTRLHPSKTQSNYRGNRDKCPFCGLTYGDFKTGLTYQEVFICLWTQSEDPSDWRYKKRRTILGYWHSLKKAAWLEHKQMCEQEKLFSFVQEPLEDELDEAVPF